MRHASKILFAVLLALVPAARAQEAPPPAASLKGKFLVADPSMPDPRFAGTVIFMIAHSGDGALGVVVNRPRARRPLANVMRAFGIEPEPGQGESVEIELFWGGPVESNRVLLLHTDEFKAESSVAVAPGVALTMPKDALPAIAAGSGPKQTLLAIGYAGWSAGQLERELESKSWAVISGGPDLLFDADAAGMWDRAWKMRAQDL